MELICCENSIYSAISFIILLGNPIKTLSMEFPQEFMDDPNYDYPHPNAASGYALFKSKDAISKCLEKERVYDPIKVDRIYKSYESCYYTSDQPLPEGVRRPFIAFESNNRKIKETVSRYVAEKLNAKYLSIPPKCMAHLTFSFDKGLQLRNAFYALSLYPLAFQARQFISQDIPVISNGYYFEQACYIIGKIFKRPGELPRRGASVYKEPSDLMMPDIVIYLNYPDIVRNERVDNQKVPGFVPKKNQIYMKFNYPNIVIVDASKGLISTYNDIMEKMSCILGDKFNLNPKPHVEIENSLFNVSSQKMYKL
uniref:Uncharacterized protein n=1 Tax=Clastoptera arizonana TaxID=38151 RepID=A0A1B6E1C1_9HEMI